MPRCAGEKRDGGRCATIVRPPLEYCYAHDPARASERKRNASKAGAAKPNAEIRDVKARLAVMIDEVLSGAVATGPYAIANQLLNTKLRAIEVERRIKEQDEIEVRLAALEERAEAETKGGRKWGV